ncbi:MAG: ABC transporter ATP-binding protein [Lachnospiraceae bacterium]|nr:ABC transporter ATP-binding protein [Lachnospiraceae bacterium]
MKRLFVYLKNYKLQCILAPLFKMLEATFELIVPLVVASLIDKGVNGRNTGHIYACCIILIALGLIGLISSCTAQFFAAYAATGFSKELREDLFTHLMSLSFKEIDGIGTSTMITRMTSDVNQAQTGVNMFLRLFLRSPFVVFGAMIMAFTIDVKSALIFVFVIFILFIIVGYIMKTNIPMLKKVQSLLDTVLMHTRENISGARVIRAFCRESDETEAFLKSNDALVNMQLKSGRLSGALNPVTYVVVNLGIVCLIYTGALQVNNGILTQGQVIALYNYMSQILVELIKLANLIITLNKALASAGRLSDVFDISCSQKDGNIVLSKEIIEESNVAVSFENVSLNYNKDSDDALENITFSVKKGDTVGVIGGTGSGKTSLISLIPRFYDATGGCVKLFGRNIDEYTIESIREHIGVVLQKAVLFKGTVADNIGYGASNLDSSSLENAAEMAVANDVVNAKGGMEGIVEQGGRNMSGGQRQRLTIARAIAKNPDILILDDSASALDFATEKKLNENIRKLDGKITTFIVTQRASSILTADKIIVLEDGQIAGIGTHDELIKSCEVYKEIYYTQFAEEKEVSHEK